ncbi:hypothetical protein L1887_48440 [Cichorium endivia]|nr:hypothetical protein L1887_48440 [Cichorium endivia]
MVGDGRMVGRGVDRVDCRHVGRRMAAVSAACGDADRGRDWRGIGKACKRDTEQRKRRRPRKQRRGKVKQRLTRCRGERQQMKRRRGEEGKRGKSTLQGGWGWSGDGGEGDERAGHGDDGARVGVNRSELQRIAVNCRERLQRLIRSFLDVASIALLDRLDRFVLLSQRVNKQGVSLSDLPSLAVLPVEEGDGGNEPRRKRGAAADNPCFVGTLRFCRAASVEITKKRRCIFAEDRRGAWLASPTSPAAGPLRCLCGASARRCPFTLRCACQASAPVYAGYLGPNLTLRIKNDPSNSASISAPRFSRSNKSDNSIFQL